MNIEIYGFYLKGEAQFMSVSLRNKIKEIKEKIRKALESVGLDIESVVTEIYSEVHDADTEDAPFIRICSTDMEDIGKIIPALKKQKIKIDVETLILNDFISKEDMV